jgi:hypothetical protein
MTEQHDFDSNDSSSFIIGIFAAALSGAFVGMVAGALGAVFAMLTWY